MNHVVHTIHMPDQALGGETGTAGSAKLSQRVVRADRAAACCRKGQIQLLQKANQIILDSFNIIENLQSDENIVQVGGVLGVASGTVQTAQGATTFEQLLARPVGAASQSASSELERLLARNVRLVRAPAARTPINPGTVAILLGVTAASVFLDIAAKTAALEALSLVGGAITGGLRYEPDRCTQCVLDEALSQAAPRRRERSKINRRL